MRRGRDEPVEPRMVGALRAGDMRARVRDFDWAATPLGPRGGWPAALTWSVDLVLASGFPMAVRWGPDQIIIYNDAYAALLGERHPAALGKPLREVWPEILDELGPLSKDILTGKSENFFAVDHPWTRATPRRTGTGLFHRQLQPVARPAIAQRHRRHSGHGVRDHRARAQRENAARSDRPARSGGPIAYARARPHLDGVGGFARRLQFRRLLHQRQSGLDHLLGWSEDEIKALHVSELRHPDDAPAANAGRARLAQGVPTVRMENRFRHRDGSWRWIAWTLTVDDGLIYVVGPQYHRRKSKRRRRCTKANANSARWSAASPTTRSSCSIRTAS